MKLKIPTQPTVYRGLQPLLYLSRWKQKRRKKEGRRKRRRRTRRRWRRRRRRRRRRSRRRRRRRRRKRRRRRRRRRKERNYKYQPKCSNSTRKTYDNFTEQSVLILAWSIFPTMYVKCFFMIILLGQLSKWLFTLCTGQCVCG